MPETPLTYYLPYLLWALMAAGGIYGLASAYLTWRRGGDFAALPLQLTTAVAGLLLPLVSAWGLAHDVAFWQTRDLKEMVPWQGYELFRALAAFTLFAVLSLAAFGLLMRRCGLERVARLLLRLLFLSLFPTTFLFFDGFIATSMLVYKEVVGIVIIGMMALVWTLRVLATGRLRLLHTPYTWPALLLWAVAGLSLAWTPSRYNSFLNFIYLSAYLAMFFMIAPEMKDRRFVRKLLCTVLLVMLVVAAGSLSQFFEYYWGGILFAPDRENVRAALGSTIGHNNAVADIMMAGVIYVLGLALLTSPRRRPLWMIPATLFLFVIVAATSRGVWLTLPVALLYFTRYWLTGLWSRPTGAQILHLARRWAFAMVLLGFILGGVVVVVNHLATRPGAGRAVVPLSERLKDFSYEINVRGTRPRLWTIGVVMLADQWSLRPWNGQPPLLGQGLSAFKWHYALYQARFFKEYPNTLVWPTHKHGHSMHNEYLQPMVELGVPGTLFIFWILLAHLALLRRIRADRPDREKRVLQITLATALVAGLIHCITNFSFHTAPLAVMLLAHFAALCGQGPCAVREFRFAGARDNPTLFAGGYAVSCLLVGLLFLFCARIVYAEFYLNLGRVFRSEAVRAAAGRTPEEQALARKLAREGWREFFLRGLRLAPGNFHLNLELAQCYTFLFDLDRETPQVDLLLAALTHMNRGMREYQHKSVYYTRGLLLRDLSQLAQRIRLAPSPRISQSDVDYLLGQAMADAERDLRIASDMFPVEYAEPVLDEDLAPLHELGTLYYAQGRHAEAFTAWGRIQRRRPGYVLDYHLAAARQAQAAGDTYRAGVSYHIARELAPENADIWKSYINFYLENRLMDKALELAREFMEAFPSQVDAFEQLVYTAHVTARPDAVFDLARAYLARERGGRHNAREMIAFTGVCHNNRRWDLLSDWLEALRQNSSDPDILLYVDNFRLISLYNQGAWAEAVAAGQEVLERRPEHEGAKSAVRAGVLFLALPVLMGSHARGELPAPPPH